MKTAAVEPAKPKPKAAAQPGPEKLSPERRASSYRAIQRQLKELNCYNGRVDGQWGRGSQAALARAYANGSPPAYGDMKALNGDTSSAVLDALNGLKPGHCVRQDTASTEPVTPRKTKKSVTKPRRTNRPRKTTTKKTTTRRKVTKKKKTNCKTIFNPEAYVDEKAPKVIRVCK